MRSPAFAATAARAACGWCGRPGVWWWEEVGPARSTVHPAGYLRLVEFKRFGADGSVAAKNASWACHPTGVQPPNPAGHPVAARRTQGGDVVDGAPALYTGQSCRQGLDNISKPIARRAVSEQQRQLANDGRNQHLASAAFSPLRGGVHRSERSCPA